MNQRIFFVLNGLVNGDEDEYAYPSGGFEPSRPLDDGWYFFRDEGDADGDGPWDSYQEADREMKKRDQRQLIATALLLFSGGIQ
jgi:hypothetical protein